MRNNSCKMLYINTKYVNFKQIKLFRKETLEDITDIFGSKMSNKH